MKRVIVIGSGGSGKSTFSRRLGDKLGIEVIHLDRLFWNSGWVPTPKDEWADKVRELVKRESWIMDGNFGGTREIRMEACDTIIFLDISRTVCIYRVLKRAIIYRKTNRPDMAEGCNEKVDREFFMWVWNYNNRARPLVLSQLERYSDKKVVTLRTSREADDFLNKL